MNSLLPFERFEREIIEKRKSYTDSSFGCSPGERSVEELINFGIINLDKPSGPSSHQTSAYVKQILGIKKAGHSGTLDPKVTGVLPVALGKATRIAEVLLTAGKEYICLMQLHKDVEEAKLRDVCSSFVGKIKQLPPVKSAVVRKLRERKIYYLEIIETSGRLVLFRVGCEAGTYIRKLVADIGSKIGGAHMAELRRTKAGPFKEKDSFTLQDVKDSFHYYKEGNEKFIRRVIRPIEEAVAHLPKVWIVDGAVDSICHGTSLKMPGISKFENGIRKDDIVAVLTLKNELVCYGNAITESEKMKTARMGTAVKPDAVFMNTGTYPNLRQKDLSQHQPQTA
ncbi:RNA-guided pseudouridylation complex pseudouridine synthase subunit Cbf5 [Candidatus Woesearchaeota archaeon]|nr:RNA-guided pseudouridylation complex pseudouridine synthase subunit Cbf5 [Candidatus Woesearchaeota archaeon]